MRAQLAMGRDLYLHFSESREVYQLVPEFIRNPYPESPIDPPTEARGHPAEGTPISSKLCDIIGSKPLCDVRLSFVPSVPNGQGVEVKLSPEGAGHWSDVERVDVMVAHALFNQFDRHGLICATYGGGDSMVRITYGPSD